MPRASMAQILEFAGNHPFLILAAAALVVLIIVNELRLRVRGVTELSPGEAIGRINRDALVLDVRTPEQYDSGHIIHALNVPLDELPGRIEDLKKKHGGNPIVTCCATGITGARAARQLRAQGFGQVYNLRGGLDAWRRENLPVEKKGAPSA
ncbi:MAG: rhodanese-like domain-containing protein, partial [Burkholderiales bacterium]